MKNIKTVSVLLICASLILSCKKKETTTPEPAPVTPVVPAHVNSVTAKVNNQSWAMYTSEFIEGTFIAKFGSSYTFGAQNALSSPYTSIQVGFTYTIGVFNLSTFGNYVAKYKDANNTFFTSRTGTINITTLPFSFNTDTINNQSYSITDGVIDFEKK